MTETHRVAFAGITRDLPLVEVAPGVRIALFNMLGDVAATVASATALAERVPTNASAIVTAEAKAIPLAHELARLTGLPYVVLRKHRKPYMGATVHATTRSITTGAEQTLHLDEKDRALVRERVVCLVDDVVSTGSTLAGMRDVVRQAGGDAAAVLAVFTEGDAKQHSDVTALGHLPVFT